MHSSKMCTTHISQHALLGVYLVWEVYLVWGQVYLVWGQVYLVPGGVPSPLGYLVLGGVPPQEGYLVLGGVPAQGVYMVPGGPGLGGCICPGGTWSWRGCTCPGGCIWSQGDRPRYPPREQNDSQTGVKHNLRKLRLRVVKIECCCCYKDVLELNIFYALTEFSNYFRLKRLHC